MVKLKRIISVTIVLMMLFTAFPVHAAQNHKGNEGTITEHIPQSRVSDEKELSGQSGSKWLWILLGVAVVAGGAAAIAGGGDDSSSTTTNTSGDTGSISGSW